MNPEENSNPNSNSKKISSWREKLKSGPLLGIAGLILILLISLLVALMMKQDEPREAIQQNVAHVSITKSGFVPSTLAVKKGTKIIWTNADSKMHQIQANPHPTGESLPGLKSEILNSKQVYEYTADSAGSFEYHDHLKPTSNGKLEVEE